MWYVGSPSIFKYYWCDLTHELAFIMYVNYSACLGFPHLLLPGTDTRIAPSTYVSVVGCVK